MASQTLSGYATEGTQYAIDGSYYVLDSIPGSGNVLDGPITVAGNLTTTGNTSVLGSLGSAGPLTAPTVNSASLSPSAGQTTPLIVTGLAAGVTVTSSGPTIVNGGSVAVGATNGDITVQSVSGQNTLIMDDATGDVELQANKVGSTMRVGNATAGAVLRTSDTQLKLETTGSQFMSLVAGGSQGMGFSTVAGAPMNFVNLGGASFFRPVFFATGLTHEGQFPDPVPITGGFKQMTTNKGFYVTNDPIVIVALPFPGIGYVIVKGIGTNSYSPQGGTPLENGTTVQFAFLPGTTNYFQILCI